ncbi:MAG: hypothetical protein ABIQ12_07490 [Opitutaceae bacterium]
MIARRAFPALLALSLALASCKKPAIESYRVAKEAPLPASAPAASTSAPSEGTAPSAPSMASTPVPTATGAALTWTAPAQWTAKAPGAMRKGSYTVKGDGADGDLSITAFPGDVGGDLANLNRWRGQIGLAPVKQAELETTTQHLDRNGLHMTVVNIVGTGAGAQRILGAMVPHAGATWFFKLTGPDALVAREQVAFAAFLDSIKPAAP